MIWENGIETCLLSYVKQITSPGSMHDTGCSAAVTGALSAAERRYPTSEVRGSGRECQAVMVQEQPRGVTQVRGQGRRLGGATPRPHT